LSEDFFVAEAGKLLWDGDDWIHESQQRSSSTTRPHATTARKMPLPLPHFALIGRLRLYDR